MFWKFVNRVSKPREYDTNETVKPYKEKSEAYTTNRGIITESISPGYYIVKNKYGVCICAAPGDLGLYDRVEFIKSQDEPSCLFSTGYITEVKDRSPGLQGLNKSDIYIRIKDEFGLKNHHFVTRGDDLYMSFNSKGVAELYEKLVDIRLELERLTNQGGRVWAGK